MAHDRVALTGASGYLGQHLVEVLDDPMLVPRDDSPIVADVVIHAAAAVPKSPAGYHDEAMAEATIMMTADVLRRLQRCRRFVYVSSRVAAYPPANAYGWGKLCSEWMVLGALPEGLIDEMMTVVLPGLFGPPRRSGAIYDAIRLTGSCGPPDWPVMHVADAAAFVATCVTASMPTPARRMSATYPPGQLQQRLDEFAHWVKHDHGDCRAGLHS